VRDVDARRREAWTPPSIVPGGDPSIVEASADFFLAIDRSIESESRAIESIALPVIDLPRGAHPDPARSAIP
jgi:hypothetical protein